MKRRDLERRIRKAAKAAGLDWHFLREGSEHTVYQLGDGTRVSIPRHREINEHTAEGIMKDLEGDLGEEWWR